MRKRHRWIDKRRHRASLGLKSPAEWGHLLNWVATKIPGWTKATIKQWKRWKRELYVAFQAPNRFWK